MLCCICNVSDLYMMMMIRFLVCYFITAGLSLGIQVHQSPTALIRNAGDDVQLVCTHGHTDYRVMLWYQQSSGDTALKLLGYGYSQFNNDSVEQPFRKHFKLAGDLTGDQKNGLLSIIKLKVSEHTATYFCAAWRRQGRGYPAYFGEGTKLTVLEHEVIPLKEENLEVLGPSSKECRNLKDNQKRKKTLLCMATDFYPDHVHMFWQLNGKNVTIGVATGTPVKKGKVYSITSRLRVPADDWSNPKNNFTCIVNFFDGSKNNISQKSIFGVVDGKNYMTKGRYLKTTQNAKLSYSIFIIKSSIYGAFVAFLVWKLQGKKN